MERLDKAKNVTIRGIDPEVWQEIRATSALNSMSVARLIELLWESRLKLVVPNQIDFQRSASSLAEMQEVQRLARH